MIKAKIVADSLLDCFDLNRHQYEGDLRLRKGIKADARRFVTFELEYPRFIHSQMMTYGFECARNTQSSRAVPVEKMIELVEASKVQPVRFGANQRGMQDSGESDNAESALVVWDRARENALESARWMMRLGIHKQAFPERLNHDSDPTIQALAVEMNRAFLFSDPIPSRAHIPYLSEIEALVFESSLDVDFMKASAVACAQVSYRKQDFSRSNVDRVWKILVEYGHGSPLEHILISDPNPSGRFVGVRTFRANLKT
jgi:hypothetical protein